MTAKPHAWRAKLVRIEIDTGMRIRIKVQSCQGCERCVNICPEVFRMWGEHLKASFEVADPEKHRQAIIKAIEECPYDAITVDC